MFNKPCTRYPDRAQDETTILTFFHLQVAALMVYRIISAAIIPAVIYIPLINVEIKQAMLDGPSSPGE